MLIFHAGHVGGFDVARVRELRILRRQAVVVIVEMVYQQAGGDDVTAGDIGLHFGQVADAQKVTVVGIGGEFGEDSVVVFAVESIVEPHLPFPQRAGKSQARQELVELPPSLVLKGRNEIGGEKVEVIIANPVFSWSSPPEPLPNSAGSRAGSTWIERKASVLIRASSWPLAGCVTLKPSSRVTV